MKEAVQPKDNVLAISTRVPTERRMDGPEMIRQNLIA